MSPRTLLPLLILLAGALKLAAIPVNLAPGKTATASTSDHGSVPGDIADGNRDGGFYSGGPVWHTVTPDAAPWVEVDLGANYYLDPGESGSLQNAGERGQRRHH